MLAQQLLNEVSALLERARADCFTDPANVSDAAAMGLLMARFFDHDTTLIALAAAFAMEDANAHTEAARLFGLAGR